jgi:hypothetical protein
MMLFAVVFGYLLTLVPELLLESRVDDHFLCYGVASQLPGELVAEALLVVIVSGVVDHLIVVP